MRVVKQRALLAYAWAIRMTERRAAVEVGLAGAGAAMSRGLLLGFLLFGAVIGSIAVGGGYRIEDTGSVTTAVGLVAVGAVGEELMFRGLLFRLVEQRTGTWVALIVTSAIGLHIAWNFAAAGIFGTVVSGSDMPSGLLHGVTSGPVLLTGGEFGPEGSIYAVLAGVLLTSAFLVLAHRRGNIVPSRRHAARIASTATA